MMSTKRDRVVLKADALVDTVRRMFEEDLEEYQSWSNMQKTAEQGRKTASARLIAHLNLVEADAVDVGDERVARSVSKSVRINRDRLLERGVDPDIIAYATVTTESEPFVRVDKIRGKIEGE